MRATPEQYREHLLALLPKGPIWLREVGTTLGALLQALADELARVHNRALALIDEADPSTTLEMLLEWERVAGLPDACAGQATTVAERRARLVARLAARGGQSAAYYVSLAAVYGFVVTIEEFSEFRAGVSNAGEPLTNGLWHHTWRVHAPAETLRRFQAGSSFAGEPLASWGNDILECVLTRAKPAHTSVLFAYE